MLPYKHHSETEEQLWLDIHIVIVIVYLPPADGALGDYLCSLYEEPFLVLTTNILKIKKTRPTLSAKRFTLIIDCSVFLTGVVQVEGQQKVQEDVRQLLCGVRGMTVLHHVQQKLNKVSIQVF